MAELMALGIAVVAVGLAVLWAIPRYLEGARNEKSFVKRQGKMPDILSRLDEFADSWMERPRAWDFVVAALGIGFLSVAIVVFRDPALVSGIEDIIEFVAFSLAIIGFAFIYAGTYFNVRRSGVYSAEATLISMSLSGVILLVLIVGLLLEG